MNRIEWNTRNQLRLRDFKKGDEVYHNDLLLGWIDEVKKPLFEDPRVSVTLASHEAKDFVFKELGLDETGIIQIIPAPLWLKMLRKIKRVFRVLIKR